MEDKYQLILDLIKQQFVSIVWTHKVQEKQADIYNERFSRLETVNIITAAMTSCGIIAIFFDSDNLIYKVAAAIASFLTLSISAYNKSFDLRNKANQNKDAANKFIGIRNRLVLLIADCHLQERSVNDIRKDFDKLVCEANELLSSAPPTTNRAIKRASKALSSDEYTFSNSEIDKFLANSLKGDVRKRKKEKKTS